MRRMKLGATSEIDRFPCRVPLPFPALSLSNHSGLKPCHPRSIIMSAAAFGSPVAVKPLARSWAARTVSGQRLARRCARTASALSAERHARRTILGVAGGVGGAERSEAGGVFSCRGGVGETRSFLGGSVTLLTSVTLFCVTAWRARNRRCRALLACRASLSNSSTAAMICSDEQPTPFIARIMSDTFT